MRFYSTSRVVTSLVLMTGTTMSGAAWAKPESVTASVKVLYAGKPLPVPSDDRKPYQDLSDNAICVAPEALEKIGISYSIGAQGYVTLSVPDRDVVRVMPRTGTRGRGPYLSVVEVIEGLGGRCQWNSATNTLDIRPVLQSVRFDGDQVIVTGTLPLRAPRVGKPDPSGAKVYFDFDGVDVGALATSRLGPVEGNVNGAKVQQVGKTARLVVSLNKPVRYAPGSSDTPTTIALGPAVGRPAPPPVREETRIVATVETTPEPKPEKTYSPSAPKPDPVIVATVTQKSDAPPPLASRKAIAGFRNTPPPANVAPGGPSLTAIRFNADNPDRSRMMIVGNRASFPVRVTNRDNRLVLDMPNAASSAYLAQTVSGFQHPLFNGVRLATASNGGSRLIFETNRAVNYQLRLNQDGGGMLLDITPTVEGDAPLRGKSIVVDPGHGGHDKGAPGVNGTHEANNTLAMSRIVVDELRLLGADVTLNRDSDTFIGLAERAYIANRQQADFFVAIHCDSAGSSAQGSTAYYHANNPADKGLAQFIANRLAAIGDVSSRGYKSDTRIYPSGFAVIRQSQMTGVLVETGFMSNWHDAEALASDTTRRKIAAAVAQGVADFVKANPDYNTKNVKPTSAGQLYVAPDDPQ